MCQHEHCRKIQAEVVDLTKDDEFGVVRSKKPSKPTADSIVIDLASDSEDDPFHPHSLHRPGQPKFIQSNQQRPEKVSEQVGRRLLQRAPVSAISGYAVPGPSRVKATSAHMKQTQLSLSSLSRKQPDGRSEARTVLTKRENTPARHDLLPLARHTPTNTATEPVYHREAPQNPEIPRPKSQILVKPYRLYCTECTETGLECDGERPCSRCAEPGFECIYPGDPSPQPEPPTLTVLSSMEHPSGRQIPLAVTRPASTSSSRTSSREANSSDSDAPLMPKSKSMQAEQPTKVNSDSYEEFPACHWTPSTYGEVKDLVTVVRQNLDIHREYWLQHSLVQSANRMRKTSPHPSPTARVNPFKELISNIKQPSKSQSERKVVVVYKGGTTTNANKKNASFIPTELGWDDKQPVLPQYKSIGRMGANYVAKNVHTIKHLPYFPDDEAEENRLKRERYLRRNYRNNGLTDLGDIVKQLVKQRACLERLHRWSVPFQSLLATLDLTPDTVVAWAQDKKFSRCETCDLTFVRPYANRLSSSLSKNEHQKCEWLLKAVQSVAKISVWHFLEAKFTGKPSANIPIIIEERRTNFKPSICMICCVPNCAVHGLCVDGTPRENDRAPLINDPEIENNRRERIVTKFLDQQSSHICGLYCTADVSGTIQYSDLFGLNGEGILTGIHNNSSVPVTSHLGFEGVKPCGQRCFIVRSKRTGTTDLLNDEARSYLQRNLSAQQISFFETHARLFRSSVRLPCSLARRLKLDCSTAFECLIMLHRSTASSSKHEKSLPILQGPKKGYLVKPEKYGDRELKKPVFPCSHEGPCRKENGCQCAEREGHCEHSCGCDETCHRRFPGCTCHDQCSSNTKCLCRAYGRECDPWVCKSCGIVEVLDPSNKYNEEIRHGRCINNRTQLGLPARTVKGSSQVQGWGLFAGEDMPKNTYVGEYKGEIVTSNPTHEAERRGVVYQQGGQEYLFFLNTEQELDGSRFGNKTRFINHTTDKKTINLRSQRQNANGIARVSFWTQRDIKAGEEFFYDYGYEAAVTKNFWTINAELNLDPLLPIPKPVLTQTGTRRANQTALDSDEDSEDSESDDTTESLASIPAASPSPVRKRTNRKRKLEDENQVPIPNESVSYQTDPRRVVAPKIVIKPISRQTSEVSLPRRTGTKTVQRGKPLKVVTGDDDDDSGYDNVENDEDDDYAEQHVPSEDSESEAEIPDSDFEVHTDMNGKPKKRDRPRLVDKRKGGEAQGEVQASRKRNRGKLGL